MKGKNKNRILLYSWLPTGTIHKNLAILEIFFKKKSGEFGPIFSMENPLYRWKL
jgi:hypothetical protein